MAVMLWIAMVPAGWAGCIETWYPSQTRLASLVAATPAESRGAAESKRALEVGLTDPLGLVRALRNLDPTGRGCGVRCTDPFLAAAATLGQEPMNPHLARRLAMRWRHTPLGGWFATLGIDDTSHGISFAREWLERPDPAMAEAVACRAGGSDAYGEMARGIEVLLDERMVDARLEVLNHWVAREDFGEASRVVQSLVPFASAPSEHPRCFDREPVITEAHDDGTTSHIVTPGQLCGGLLMELTRLDQALEAGGQPGLGVAVAGWDVAVAAQAEPATHRIEVRVDLSREPWVSARCPVTGRWIEPTRRGLRAASLEVRRSVARAWLCDDASLASATRGDLAEILAVLEGVPLGRLAFPLASRLIMLGDDMTAAGVLKSTSHELRRRSLDPACRDDGWTSPPSPSRGHLLPSVDCARDRDGWYALAAALPEPQRSDLVRSVDGDGDAAQAFEAAARGALAGCAPVACGRVEGRWDGLTWRWRSDPGTSDDLARCARRVVDVEQDAELATDTRVRVSVSGYEGCHR